MHAIILTAGEGARLGSWTSNRPKGMVPIGNRPILDYLVRGIVKSGVKKIHMVVGYSKNSVMSYFGDGSSFGAKISYFFQEKRTGTLEAMRIGMSDDVSDFILVPGDNYVSSDSFSKLRAARGLALLSGKADRWSKWGEIELEKGKPKITFDSPEAYQRIHFTGIAKLNSETADKLINSSGKHIGEALELSLIHI